jgi:GNAT superfamily N-acetyltransferase
MARVIIDTGRAAHRAHTPDGLLDRQPLEEAYAESERNWRRSLAEIAENPASLERIFVAEDETGAVVGLVMGGPARQELLPNCGEVYVLYVRQSHQRAGLGRQFVHTVTRHLAGAGFTSLVIGCLAANAPARRFYEALGGRVVAEREFDQDGVLLPEVVYGWEGDLPL